MSNLELARPWLVFDLDCEMQVLSWAINRPGLVLAKRIVWREVRNADLPEGMDVPAWFGDELQSAGYTDAVAFLTSRDMSYFHEESALVGATTAHCVATVGLSNAERVGSRVDRHGQDWGTINVCVEVDRALSQAGLIEALSIAAQARTVAIMDTGLMLPTGLATGTGTDCIAVAAHVGAEDYAGLHTEIGEAVGAAVYRATLRGAQQWKSQYWSND